MEELTVTPTFSFHPSQFNNQGMSFILRLIGETVTVVNFCIRRVNKILGTIIGFGAEYYTPCAVYELRVRV
jgi:hypothetical protein